ncbi:MAG: thioredoxin fold domain-containing protein [Thauera phenolivorans]|uniref:Thioredoxin fold domain-containing protein n=1 Tax=Thauera phenolivorans TaxID=1792543 RepID=A0A7X7LT70_9RHOO|nr:thioredoxin fold domain-containing protein [Thauera phenolivorans]NLF52937.1 thioredoxin fold domain-containing protein [Thauera phenolivorans]
MPTTDVVRRSAASGFAPMVRGLLAILACTSLGLSAAPPALPQARDLAADARLMEADGLPMVVLYSQAGCHYCEQARDYLGPMAQSSTRALFRQIDLDSDAPLTDFAGRPSTHREFTRAHEVRFTPTVVIYDARGRPVGEPIVGMTLPDFYAQYVDNAIDAAHEKNR